MVSPNIKLMNCWNENFYMTMQFKLNLGRWVSKGLLANCHILATLIEQLRQHSVAMKDFSPSNKSAFCCVIKHAPFTIKRFAFNHHPVKDVRHNVSCQRACLGMPWQAFVSDWRWKTTKKILLLYQTYCYFHTRTLSSNLLNQIYCYFHTTVIITLFDTTGIFTLVSPFPGGGSVGLMIIGYRTHFLTYKRETEYQ